jgi:hypothetical protein
MRRRTSCIWMCGLPRGPDGGDKRETKVPGTFVSLFEKGGKYWIFTI